MVKRAAEDEELPRGWRGMEVGSAPGTQLSITPCREGKEMKMTCKYTLYIKCIQALLCV